MSKKTQNKLDGVLVGLNRWYLTQQRDLPWRGGFKEKSASDPYRTWVSEIMLQQTQVKTVIPYFKRWMAKFPNIEALAAASLDEVYALWAGLGYYSRARNLHRGAKMVLDQQSSVFPTDVKSWLLIPGVGSYTAGAICSIALNQPVPIVDGNVVRVLARFFAIKKIGPKKLEIWDHAEQWVRRALDLKCQPRDFNQALMELGATICKPKQPMCMDCPLTALCQGKKNPEQYPSKKVKTKVVKLKEQKWVLRCQNHVLLFQSIKKWRQGLWDFPDAGAFPIKHATLMNDFSLKYVVTNHQVTRHHQLLDLKTKIKAKIKTQNGQWFKLDALPGLPAPTKKAINQCTCVDQG